MSLEDLEYQQERRGLWWPCVACWVKGWVAGQLRSYLGGPASFANLGGISGQPASLQFRRGRQAGETRGWLAGQRVQAGVLAQSPSQPLHALRIRARMKELLALLVGQPSSAAATCHPDLFASPPPASPSSFVLLQLHHLHALSSSSSLRISKENK